jgi:hypothetical protein
MNPHIRTYLTETTRNQCRWLKLLEISIAQVSGAREVVQDRGCGRGTGDAVKGQACKGSGWAGPRALQLFFQGASALCAPCSVVGKYLGIIEE